MNCPGCGAAMQSLDFERLPLGALTLDFCFPCQVVWFDEHESTELSPDGVVAVFKLVAQRQTAARNALPALPDCPRCHSQLVLTHDLQRTTHFTYWRCAWGHGRLTPFVQFLLEKNFVRPLSGAELAALKSRVKSVQCSNCGAPVDLQRDAACPYCASPLSILDPDAVANALHDLDAAAVRHKTIDVDLLADALLQRPPDDSDGRLRAGFSAGAGSTAAFDLVAAGIGIVAAMLR